MYKSVAFVYHNSVEKWEGIRRFAEANNLEVKYINAMIAKIEEAGDASLYDAYGRELVDSDSYTVSIGSADDYFGVMYSTYIHPCPHCVKYSDCRECPLWDKECRSCCKEWEDAKNEARRALKRSWRNLICVSATDGKSMF